MMEETGSDSLFLHIKKGKTYCKFKLLHSANFKPGDFSFCSPKNMNFMEEWKM